MTQAPVPREFSGLMLESSGQMEVSRAVALRRVLWSSGRAAEWAVPEASRASQLGSFEGSYSERLATFSSLVGGWLKVQKASPGAPGLIPSNLGISYRDTEGQVRAEQALELWGACRDIRAPLTLHP